MLDVTHLSETKRRLLELRRLGSSRPSSILAAAKSRRKAETPARLSLAQEQVWLREQQSVSSAPIYNESITIHRDGFLDITALDESLREVIRRNEIWRTTFEEINGQPVQIVHRSPAIPRLQVVDVSTFPEAEREAEAIRVAAAQANPPFNLRQGPLVRAVLVKLGDQAHRLFLTMHQLVVDGLTVYSLFPSELITIYEAYAAGKPSPLPPPTIQYADFGEWQRLLLAGDLQRSQLAYWREKLSGELPILPWPKTRPPCETFRGVIYPFSLPKD